MLELMAITGVLSILMTISIPAFSRWVPSYKLKGAARDLFSDLNKAKMTAVNQMGECAVVFDITNNCYRVWSGGTNRVYDNASGDDVLIKTVNLTEWGNGLRYGNGNASSPIGETFGDGVTFSSNRVVFDSRGMINSLTGGYVYLQNNRNGVYAAGVQGSGVILLRRWTGATWQ